MAKGQMRSNREKKKPKAEKNKKKRASVPLVFERVRMIGKLFHMSRLLMTMCQRISQVAGLLPFASSFSCRAITAILELRDDVIRDGTATGPCGAQVATATSANPY